MKKEWPIVGKIVRRPTYIYFVDAQGNVREAQAKNYLNKQ